jgi:dTMP kinase
MAAGRKRPRGLFVTFEGIDGCGKSTQLASACCYLRELGYHVCRLREPGSTPAAERIRKILLDPRSSLSDITELLLYEAARAEIVAREIQPALASGHIVLCDRFFDSTTAYQGYGRKLDIGMVRRLHKIAVGEVVPDLTLVLDVDVKTSCARRGKRPDRLESQSRAFFNRVRRGFLEIAASEPRRVKVIDSTRPMDEVFADIIRHLNQRLKPR